MTTKNTSRPLVLHVDDEPDDLRSWNDEVKAQDLFDLDICHPQDVVDVSLQKAALILVDFKIENWPQRTNTSALALRPPNGLAVLATLQETAFELAPRRARAFALYTAVIADVARELVRQPHIVARAHNLEWVFEKSGNSNPIADRARRVAELANAVNALPLEWPGENPSSATTALHSWLELSPSVPWFDAAARAIRTCRPPIHEFAEHTAGMGVLRWILHKILPYPTFLLDDAHLAARLRVSLASLRAVARSRDFAKVFGSAEYRGQLSSFSGQRWWRAGIEHALFEATIDKPNDLTFLHEVLKRTISGLDFKAIPRLFPVLGPQFITQPELASEQDIVEVRPDDWPAFADEAWARRADLEDAPELKAVTVAEGE